MGLDLVPGWGTSQYTVDFDLAGLFFGPMGLSSLIPYALISGAARDAGNTGNTTVLRPGLVMAQLTASPGKWVQFTSGASDGSQYARGVLSNLGLNTQAQGADADRYLASIVAFGNLNPEAVCLGTSATYGLARSGVGLTVRKHLKYNIRFSDDIVGDLIDPLSGR